jgi:glycosyltransferase involved in cell wall biosynthesis
LNNYDVGRFAEEPPSAPRHFLFGIDSLHQRGYRIVIGDERTRKFLRSIERLTRMVRLPIPLGDLSRQWNALPQLRSADLIYCPCDSVAWGLCYLRALGIVRVPVVCLAHHRPLRGRAHLIRRSWIRLALRGVDAFPSLSRRAADDINQLAPGRALSRVLDWGPDLDFYPPYKPPGHGVVSAGRTGRQFDILGAAASTTLCPTTIICPSASVSPAFRDFRANVTVLAHDNPIHYTYQDLIKIYANSSVIAIPTGETKSNLCGLTSLLDALAMGRAVIMTRNPLIDIDIEAERIGIWVEPGESAGWERALEFMSNHPDEAAAMGVRARRLAEDRYNSQAFSDQLHNIVAEILDTRPGEKARKRTLRQVAYSKNGS